MRKAALIVLLLLSRAASPGCLPMEKAAEKVGADTCVTGKVIKVVESRSGTWFLDFCEDYRTCPFTVVVFPSNPRDVGDVRLLEGKTIEVHGRIKEYGGRAEIIVRDRRQLSGDIGSLPPMPKGYDAERRGNARARAVNPKKPPAAADLETREPK